MIDSRVALSCISRLIIASLVPALLAAQEAPARVPTVVPVPATPLPRTHEAQPTVADITAQDLMTRLYIFADGHHGLGFDYALDANGHLLNI
jgi:hypothetical protein